MKYQKFIIEQYKGIAEPIEINIEKSDKPPIIPIIGTNESGKSTALLACFAFDYRNDIYDKQIGHLTQCETNLYRPENLQVPSVKVSLEVNRDTVSDIIERLGRNQGKKRGAKEKLALYLEPFGDDKLTIEVHRLLGERNDETLGYTIPLFENKYQYKEFVSLFIESLPPIIYFDDFKDNIPNTIYFEPEKKFAIQEDEDNTAEEGNEDVQLSPEGYANRHWYSLLNALFESTRTSKSQKMTLKGLGAIDENRRDSLLKSMTNKLNEELDEFWKTLRLDIKLSKINIDIKYNLFNKLGGALTLKIYDDDKSFNLEHRSKGFKWFFNFIMKVKYYPSKFDSQNSHVLFLLDEPGAYLHPEAQKNLCRHLSTILTNVQDGAIFYTTHSPYLLNPDFLSINNLHIVSNASHNISMSSYSQSKQGMPNLKNAWQPVYDAIKVNSSVQLDCNLDKVILVEGITDYYAIKLFLDKELRDNNIKIMPCEGAGGIKSQLAYMLLYDVSFVILLDNDDAGDNAKKTIQKHYPHLSDLITTYNKKLENLVHTDEEDMMTAIEKSKNIKLAWIPMYFKYRDNRDEMIKLFSKTNKNFKELFTKVLSILQSKSI